MNNSLWFDEGVYLKNKAAQCGLSETDTLNAINSAGMDLFTHYARYGEAEGVSPNDLFNPVQYARAVAQSWNESGYKNFFHWGETDVLALVQGFGVTLYDHFSQVGWLQNLNASNAFDVAAYMGDKAVQCGLSVPDTINAFMAAGVDAVTHYLAWGKDENIPITTVPLDDAVRAASTFNALPNDPLFAQQWHLQNIGQAGATPGMDLHVVPVWANYTGKGVIAAVVDDGLEFDHPDLAKNIDTSLSLGTNGTDGQPLIDRYVDKEGIQQIGDAHGVSCGGALGAVADNGIGGSGVAPGVTLASVRISFSSSPEDVGDLSPYDDALTSLNYDILSDSWGESSYVNSFESIDAFRKEADSVSMAATQGRDGKGSVILIAAGNDNNTGQDVALDSAQNTGYTLSVGAVDMYGQGVSYSTPGSQVLVSTPSQNWIYDYALGNIQTVGSIVTTDRQGEQGYNTAASPKGDDNYTFSGTSASCPLAAGVVALMLEANPNLGYRDVQAILALSARNTDPTNPQWVENGADNWNGGGLSHHRQMGYGFVDATAAVRLAETWEEQNIEANRSVVSQYTAVNAHIPDGGGRMMSSGVAVTENIQVEHATVFLNFNHAQGTDVLVRLVSPSGTVSTLLNATWSGEDEGNSMRGIYALDSVGFLGEDSRGEWTLEVVDKQTNYEVGTVKDWTLELSGKADSADDTYIYTNDFARVAVDPARTVLTDTEGYNVINTAAVTGDVYMDLRASENGLWITDKHVVLAEGTTIQRLLTGDGNDTVVTNSLGNIISTGRGNDTIIVSGPGTNVIDGGGGLNAAQFFGNRADYNVQLVEGHYVVTGQDGVNELYNVQLLHFADQTTQMDFMTQFA